MCDALCRTHRPIPVGTAVMGTYHGARFTGVVIEQRGGLHFCLPRYTVAVDAPFEFMGEPRTQVTVDVTETVRRGNPTNTQIERIPPPPGVTP